MHNSTGAPLRSTIMQDLPAGAKKQIPIASGFDDYFPDAIAAVAKLSWVGNDQHNAGQPLYWHRGKSGDEWDALRRHFLMRGTVDTDGVPHSVKVAWRAMAALQKEIEANPEMYQSFFAENADSVTSLDSRTLSSAPTTSGVGW